LEPKTADEIVLARLYRGFGGRKLAEMNEVNLSIAVDFAPIPPKPGDLPESQALRQLRARTCSADAIFVGRVSGYQVRLNEGGTWLFTIYKVMPVAKVGSSDLASVVSLSTPSGVVDVAGKTVKTTTLRMLDDARHYLFFAKRIPETTAYSSMSQSDEVSWPANRDLQARFEGLTQLKSGC
jgi:hypothetical protein